MQIEIIKKEEMDALKKLAELSVSISEANASFEGIKNTETEYLKLREGKVEKQIEKLLEGSEDLLRKTHKNYEGVQSFCNTLKGYKEFLDENYEEFSGMLAEFKERNIEWDRRYEEQVIELGKQEKQIRKDAEDIEKSKEEIEETKEQIRKDKKLLEDRRQTLSRAIERLKNNRK